MRIVVWFSCGTSSAVAAKLAIAKYGDDVSVVYCDTMKDEHPDNQRFFEDIQKWLGVPIQRIASTKYASVDEVFEARKYMSGIAGAPCTVEMKKVPRFAFQRPGDIQIYGFRTDEASRIRDFEARNFDLNLEWPLRDKGYNQGRCEWLLASEGIKLPVMYALGYKNNNCLGCVKATSPAYWNAIRQDFPDVFAKRAEQSRRLGARLTRVKGERIFLDELPYDADEGFMENISCGPDCGPVESVTP